MAEPPLRVHDAALEPVNAEVGLKGAVEAPVGVDLQSHALLQVEAGWVLDPRLGHVGPAVGPVQLLALI